MKSIKKTCPLLTALLFISSPVLAQQANEEPVEIKDRTPVEDMQARRDGLLNVYTESLIRLPKRIPQDLVYDSGVDIPYPEDGVKGIFVPGHSASDKTTLNNLVDFISSTDLNSIVIDVKEDYGNIVLDIEADGEFAEYINNALVADNDPAEILSLLDEHDIYPIARVVTFKDTMLATERPDLSFREADGSVWKNGNGEAFVNPYEKEVWEYTLDIAKKAARLGFKDIQFDYVRFPEGFEVFDETLTYSRGDYEDSDLTAGEQRMSAVNDFVKYAREELRPFGVETSVDVFGYAAFIREAPGIGQSFLGISEHVDSISAMIYPSHWGPGNFNVPKPDLEPYDTIDGYMELENELLAELEENAPRSRPWIQDFTASYLGAGNFKEYQAEDVTAQIQALYDNGVEEYLIWNATGDYSRDAKFKITE